MEWLKLEVPAAVVKKYTDAGFVMTASTLSPYKPDDKTGEICVRGAIRFNGESIHFIVRFQGSGATEQEALETIAVTTPLPPVRVNREIASGKGNQARMNNAVSWAVKELRNRLALFSTIEVAMVSGGKVEVHKHDIATLPGYIRNGICAFSRSF